MKDLLSRASKNGEDGISLDLLAVDIAQSLDGERARDLWTQYQGGAKGVFHPQIYTEHGQGVFQKAQSQYEEDAKFREDAVRYMTDFEKLLADVNRTDHGGIMTMTHLASDAGKVYTMLAHASGRLA